MSRMYAFHKTVIGHLHILNGFPCEDASASYTSGNGRYHIIAVADGHGSKSCFRSRCGSKIATEVALENLQQFANSILASEEIEERFYRDIFSNPRYRQMTIKRLTDTIVAEWNDRVLEDYSNNPPTHEEIGEDATEPVITNNLSHVYGTTLIAALQLPQCLLLLQQGDGRCDVFYADGSVEQPIPWDIRCEDTTTTSLCDIDAAESIRNCIIDTVNKPVIACFLGCDGVEDAYRDTYEALGGSHDLMGGVHSFYKDLICKLSQNTQIDFENYLNEMLPDFSANGRFSRIGSGDDVSVAGIVDLEAINLHTDAFEYDVRLYSLEEELFWKEDELRGKNRKHGILKKRMNESQSILNESSDKLKTLDELLKQKFLERENLSKNIDQLKMELEDYQKDSQSAAEQFEGRYSRFTVAIQKFFDEITTGYSQKESVYKKKLEQLVECERKIDELEIEREQLSTTIIDLSNKYQDAQKLFTEYDAKYQSIFADKICIEQQITELTGGNT